MITMNNVITKNCYNPYETGITGIWMFGIKVKYNNCGVIL